MHPPICQPPICQRNPICQRFFWKWKIDKSGKWGISENKFGWNFRKIIFWFKKRYFKLIFCWKLKIIRKNYGLGIHPGPPQFHTPSVQHISSTQKGHSFSAPKIPQFHTKNPSVQHKPLSSTPKNPQFHPPQFHTKNPSVPHKKPLYKRALQFFFYIIFKY